MPTIQKLLPDEYYTALLTSEYRNSTKFIAWLQAVLKIARDISNCLYFIDNNFDLDYAVGNQLDVLGVIVGVGRIVPWQPTTGSPILDDDTYRILIRATISNNQWDGKINSLYSIWSNLFPGGSIVIIDNQNMTADIVLSGSFTPIIQDLIMHGMIVPRPETVAYNYIFAGLPLYGWDRHDSFIDGFDVGKWS